MWVWLIVWIAALVCSPGLAASEQPLFESSGPIALTLRGPVRALVRDDGSSRKEWPFELELASGASIDAQLRVRGNFRREACSFPPLRLNVKRSAMAGTLFAGQDKLKIVTHCKPRRSYELNTLQEYAAYRILNLLTDVSFRVRLVQMSYVEAREDPTTRYAFFIEAPESVAARLGGEFVEPDFVRRSALDPAHTTLVALFQFLIANTDFSPVARMDGRSCCHNTKLIAIEETLLAVPYDFDMSGLVNAAYAGPNPIVQNENVRKRVYLGQCTDRPVLQDAINRFVDVRAQIEVELASIPGYSDAQRKRDLAFLEGFYRILDDDPLSYFSRRCRRTEAL